MLAIRILRSVWQALEGTVFAVWQALEGTVLFRFAGHFWRTRRTKPINLRGLNVLEVRWQHGPRRTEPDQIHKPPNRQSVVVRCGPFDRRTLKSLNRSWIPVLVRLVRRFELFICTVVVLLQYPAGFTLAEEIDCCLGPLPVNLLSLFEGEGVWQGIVFLNLLVVP